MKLRRRLARICCCGIAAQGLFVFSAAGHTLPISFLHIVPDAGYVHLELIFNPFELSFMSEVDDNKDGELSPAELRAHGQTVADRVVGALKLSVRGREVRAEIAGLDPDLSGHHVRLLAHYKVDARHVPLTLESDLISIMSASHLTQVTYAYLGNTRLAQLDSVSRMVTFAPLEKQPSPHTSRDRPVFGMIWALLAVLTLLIAGAGSLLFMRKHDGP